MGPFDIKLILHPPSIIAAMALARACFAFARPLPSLLQAQCRFLYDASGTFHKANDGEDEEKLLLYWQGYLSAAGMVVVFYLIVLL